MHIKNDSLIITELDLYMSTNDSYMYHCVDLKISSVYGKVLGKEKGGKSFIGVCPLFGMYTAPGRVN